jgi:hypothetical protein
LLKELRQLGSRAEDVVRDLVGEAFNRLDPLAQEVMQALAVYGVPVPAVAVDYLLQPYRVGIESSKTLGRLVNMHFVRGEAGRYYLHQVDRDYALARIEEGEPDDRDVDAAAPDPLRFTPPCRPIFQRDPQAARVLEDAGGSRTAARRVRIADGR